MARGTGKPENTTPHGRWQGPTESTAEPAPNYPRGAPSCRLDGMSMG